MKTNKNMSFEEIGKELPFSVPDNYFEQFANQIDKQIGYNSTRSHKIFRPWMYATAAVFVGVMVLTPVFYTANNQSNIVKNTDNYETYVLSQVDESALLDCYVENSSAK
jgi:hypothetical protein